MQVLIDDRQIEIPAGERLNGIEAARLAGIEIPHYCWHPGLSVVGSCRMCLVEVGRRDPQTGDVDIQPKLVPACNILVADGMVLVTNSEKVARARAMVEEDLLLRHPIDCPICDKAGECVLQDYHFQYGHPERRADLRPFSSRRRDLGDVTLFVDRCVMCSRCVRFTAEISGSNELMVVGRAAREEIDVMAGFPLNNKLSGNVVDLCPVGALCNKDFLYKQRVWYLKRHESVCTGCATGCSIWIEENQQRIWRIRPRENPLVNKWWMCNDGRYDYPHVHNPERLTMTYRRAQPGAAAEPIEWNTLKNELPDSLRQSGRLAAVVSPFLSVEEAYLLCQFIRNLDADSLLTLGPVPTVGQDERFRSGFTIAAEKCPNRRGVEPVVAHFTGRVDGFEQLLSAIESGTVQGVWFSGGYKRPWIDETTAQQFAKIKCLVLQDLFPSPLCDLATYVLPSAAYPERDGSYVNRADRLQTVRWAIRPPRGVRPEGSLLWELTGRKGLYNSQIILDEVAREIPYFSAIVGPVPATGVDLRGNWLAGGEIKK